ncbi:MAG: SDR family NAD(P)-dependent oxidoreductase [Actinomycetota bacterium]|nr:SDR family NAD(P)-dependent oxidoreductase [Actinomycetota bacterium]
MSKNVRVALVTGAGSESGIGFAIAKELTVDHDVVVVTSTTERIYDRAKELTSPSCQGVGFICDHTDEVAVLELFQKISELGTVKTLVNNAGMVQVGQSEEFPQSHEIELDTWNKSIARNLTTALLATRSALAIMRPQRFGRIINIGSTTGFIQTNVGEVAYASAKAAMVGMTKTVALENATLGITCNAIAPGWIATPSSTEEEIRHGSATPIGRSGRPDEIASLARYLASEGSSYLTGQIIVVDGGNSLIEGLSR